MQDVLYQYCVGYLSDAYASNQYVISKCSRIFLIDGQPIPFGDQLLRLAQRDAFADAALFDRKNTKGQDSIHFQQIRAYTLAEQLLANQTKLQGGDEKLRIAVVGAGFSGLTAALALLKKGGADVHVTLFEHHKELMPRFMGAYGRRVYPYHHLRLPADPTRRSGDEIDWDCPIRGAGHRETGGIDGILQWRPGRVEDVFSQVRDAANVQLKSGVRDGRLEMRLHTRVHGIDPTGLKLNVGWIDFSKNRNATGTATANDELNDDFSDSGFHAVVIAPGSGRDAVSLVGQSNAEYWNPARLMNADPHEERHEIAIIGAGNTAAAEVFNYLLPDHGFVALLATLQEWANSDQNVATLLAATYVDPLSETTFDALLPATAWDDLRDRFESELVAEGLLHSTDYVAVTMYVRTSDPLFREMNPVNRFVVHLLQRLGFIDLQNAYSLHKLNSNGSLSRTYNVRMVRGRVKLFARNGKELLAKSGREWSRILNCTGPVRHYQRGFKGDRITTKKFLYRVKGRKVFATLIRLLERKQKVLGKKEETPVVTPAVAA